MTIKPQISLVLIGALIGACSLPMFQDAKIPVAAQVGANQTSNQVGGNQTIDSKVALYAVIGLSTVSLAMTGFYRHTAKGAQGAAGLVIRQLEARRRREPCTCGECATCVIESLRNSNEKWAKHLHKCVKRETAT